MSSSLIQVATNASVAQSVEQGTENPRVTGSIPVGATICGFSSSGRAPPCQGGGSEFEPRNPLQSVGEIFSALPTIPKQLFRDFFLIYKTLLRYPDI